jgi:hypothetical protein
VTTQPTKPSRPDEETLILAKDLADDVLSSPIITAGERFQMHIHLSPGEPGATFDEPDRRLVRDLLGVLRNFDMRDSDVRMPRLFEIIERVGLKPEWRPALEHVRKTYEARDEPSWIQLQDPEAPTSDVPTWLRPRKAFDLWAYGELIHHDYDKQLRWERLGPFAQGFARQMAYEYMELLLTLVALMRRVITWGLEKHLVDP